MGATAGHMMHPYENLDLSFDEMRGIFDIASKGFPKLKVTEKTDGQNIAIGYDPASGDALAIRNKSHAIAGGLDREKLKRYFTTDRIEAGKNPTPMNVVDSFYDAMQNFEKIARTLPPEFFITPEGERIFYNAEVMDPRSANVVDYDTQVLLIHRVGHKKLTPAGLVSFETSEAEQRSIELENRLQTLQQTSPEISTVKVNAIIDFTDFIEKKDAHRAAINELRIIQGSAKTVGEYLRNEIRKQLAAAIGAEYSSETHERMVDALMFFAEYKMPRKTREIAAVLETVPDESKHPFIKEFLTTRGTMKPVVDRAMRPLVMVVHRFATRVLEGFISGYTLQADVSLEKLRKKVGSKARELSDPGDLKILKTSLAKIHGGEDVGDVLSDNALEAALEKITTSVEGLVFDYNGNTYKFTGQFAPINQMLGLGKYDRGSKETVSEALESPTGKAIIAVYPGRFQPMGRHHAEVFKRIQDIYGVENSFIATSDVVKLPKSPFNFEEKQRIAVGHGIDPFSMVKVKNPYYARELTDNYDPETTSVVYLVGAKDMAENPRFSKTEGTTKEGFDWAVDVAPHVSIDIPGVGEMSGTSLRRALSKASLEMFKAIMGFSDPEIYDMIRARLSGIQEQKKTFSLLYSLVEEAIEERKKKTKISKAGQERVSKKIAHLVGDEGKSQEQAAAIAYSMEDRDELEETSAMAAGNVQGYAGGPMRKRKKNKRGEEDLVGEIMNYLLDMRYNGDR